MLYSTAILCFRPLIKETGYVNGGQSLAAAENLCLHQNDLQVWA